MGTSIAEIIAHQLGGSKFVAMTGAKGFGSFNNGLTFRLPSNFAKDGINAVRITLEANDTYTMDFMKVRGTNVKDIAQATMVYFDQLQSTFTEYTGLETRI